MNKAILATALAITTLGSAQAQERVEISAQAQRPVHSVEFEAVQGRYRLSDGRTLEIRRRGAQVFAQMLGEAQLPLRVASHGHLHTTDGQMSLRFIPTGPEEVDVVVTLHGRGQTLARGEGSSRGG